MKHTGANSAAFPRPCGAANSEEQNLQQDGMTIREWYAGQCLAGLIANSDLSDLLRKGFAPAKAAEVCFEIADAMIAQSKKEEHT